MIVSIHAPTRGATRRSGSTIGCYRIVSIHAPTRGATQQVLGLSRAVRGFNPRTHTGCDIVMSLVNHNYEFVSIHAPTRGATEPVLRSITFVTRRFNPRTHTGCDSGVGYSLEKGKFQSTHPHGVRHLEDRARYFVRLESFNPRTHTGCDSDNMLYLPQYNVSIHAPTRGATAEKAAEQQAKQIVSIHAPTRGATQSHCCWRVISGFQSTHPHGVRHYHLPAKLLTGSFQSTHPHGVRHQ